MNRVPSFVGLELPFPMLTRIALLDILVDQFDKSIVVPDGSQHTLKIGRVQCEVNAETAHAFLRWHSQVVFIRFMILSA